MPGSEPRGVKTEADTSRTNEKALERCFFAETSFVQLKATSNSLRELNYSVWLDSFSQMPHVARESPAASLQSTPVFLNGCCEPQEAGHVCDTSDPSWKREEMQSDFCSREEASPGKARARPS